MSDLGNFVNDIGSGVSDLFSGEGSAAQANDYSSAALLANQNAQLSAASTRIQETQTARAVAQTLGTQQTDVAGAGFTESGSALDLLKSSASQGALAKSLVNIQGAMNENSYAAQAGAYQGEAAAAKEATNASTVGAIASVGGALISGTGQLASAGQTVSKAYDYITGGSTTPEVQSLYDSLPAISDGTDSITTAQLYASLPNFSATDSALQSGASLTDAFTSSASAAVDTSQVALGTSADAVSTGIGDFLSGSVADLASGVGDALAFAAEGAAEVAGDVVAAGASILEGIGSVAEFAVALSVICTAYYRRGMVPKTVWHGCQRYGHSMPDDVFAGYLFWAFPIAQRIKASPRFATFMAPFFMPVMYEMSREAGVPFVSTFRGRISLKILYAVSWVFGKMLKRRGTYVTAST